MRCESNEIPEPFCRIRYQANHPGAGIDLMFETHRRDYSNVGLSERIYVQAAIQSGHMLCHFLVRCPILGRKRPSDRNVKSIDVRPKHAVKERISLESTRDYF